MTNPPKGLPLLVPEVQIRHEFCPGDLGILIELHGVLYAQEYGFDHTFEVRNYANALECRLKVNELKPEKTYPMFVGSAGYCIRVPIDFSEQASCFPP